jgi:hypothetical protein
MKKQARSTSRKSRKPVSHAAESGCTTTQRWTLLNSTEGLVPVWISVEHYDRVAKDFARTAKEKYLKKMLLQRLAPIGIEPACVGNCSDGAGCGWILLQDGGTSKLYVCDCVYTS